MVSVGVMLLLVHANNLRAGRRKVEEALPRHRTLARDRKSPAKVLI
jgi:hypothetical protein